MKKSTNEMIADLHEAMEKVREWKPLYEAVLKQTGDKKQAANAVKWAMKMEKEVEVA